MIRFIRRILIGRPLHSKELLAERLPKWKALAIFSSDALSSVAYGPEQIMLILAVSGFVTYGYLGPIAIAILALLGVVTISYVQVAHANPGGGGSYSVAINNLGELPALVAGAALLADYTLTVAVSVAAGTAAITSAFPDLLLPYTLQIDLAVLFCVLTLINLRGVRESSNFFVFPTYAFITGILALVFFGIYNALAGSTPIIPQTSLAAQQMDWSLLFLALRAFANGCSSMTGVEAIANGVPMLKKPEAENAAITTYMMSGVLGIMFAGITFLVLHYHLVPQVNVTALSVLAETIFGRGWVYYYIQITTMLVLYLAANTAFNGLPPLLAIMAKDGYAPRFLSNRGERLGFSNGIIMLSLFAAALIIGFEGSVDRLIELYAVGVFLSFTIAQTGMVRYWHRVKGKGWYHRAFLNTIGAIVTAIVVLIIIISKFFHGAWIIMVFIPFMVFVFLSVKHHYNDIAEQLRLPEENFTAIFNGPRARNLVIVPISSTTSVVAQALRYAKSISDNVVALNITTSPEESRKITDKWQALDSGVQLVTVYSPYRLVIQPILDFINELTLQKMHYDYITIIIPEFETKKLWHRLLHGQTGWILRTLLILKENVIVATLPYQLKK